MKDGCLMQDRGSGSRLQSTDGSARVHIPQEELQRLGKITLAAGMPVVAFIRTGDRSALSYLVKPLADQIARAMREE